MKLEVLISTMYQRNHDLLDKMNIGNESCVVVNQSDFLSNLLPDDKRVVWIDSLERGLSKSRNLAIKNANADICLLADDDIVYLNDYSKIIKNAFKCYDDYDIIVFKVQGLEKEFKKYRRNIKEIDFWSVRSVASVEIAFKLSSIKNNNIRFNELFGSGSKFNHGEENLFLYKCLEKGLKILYIPQYIARLHIGESTWFKGYNKKYFCTNGAIFYNISKNFYWLFILRFAIVHYFKYRKTCSIYKAIKYMVYGKNIYMNKYSAKHNNI